MAGYPLPTELTAIVISYLALPPNCNPAIIQEPSPVAQYAGVSREWQGIVERHTFSTLHLTTPQRLTEFEKLVVQNARRRSYVRNINLLVQLESYDVEARARFETAEEHRGNNEIFTKTIQRLFGILHSWPADDKTEINLSIKAQSPGDVVPSVEGQKRSREALQDPSKDLRSRRFEQNYLQFDEGSLDGLPAVSVITEFSVDAGYRGQRFIAPASCAMIASKLPRLRTVWAVLCDCEKRDLALRKRNRNEFARSFDRWPSSVEKFYLTFYNDPPANEALFPPDLTEGNAEDPLSSSLRNFSQQLTHLSLEDIVVGKELFWSPNSDDKTPLPYWPNLTSFYLTYTIATPSGQWYFERDPNESEDEAVDDEDYDSDRMEDYLMPPEEDRFPNSFRTKPSPQLMNDFYVAAGRAAQQMPKLKDMQLDTTGSSNHSFRYEVSGSTATVEWSGMSGFEPEERVLQVWREVARRHTGSDNLEVRLGEW